MLQQMRANDPATGREGPGMAFLLSLGTCLFHLVVGLGVQ